MRKKRVAANCHWYCQKSSCQVEVKHKRTEEFCAAAATPELQEETQGGGQSVEDRQREVPELKLIIDFQEEGVLPRNDKKARELLLSRAQYHMEESVLYYTETDKTLRLIIHQQVTVNICLKRHTVENLVLI